MIIPRRLTSTSSNQTATAREAVRTSGNSACV